MKNRPKDDIQFQIGDWVYFHPKKISDGSGIDTVRGLVVETKDHPTLNHQRVGIDWEDGYIDPVSPDGMWSSNLLMLV